MEDEDFDHVGTQKPKTSGPCAHTEHLRAFGFAASGQAIFATYVQQA